MIALAFAEYRLQNEGSIGFYLGVGIGAIGRCLPYHRAR